MCFLVCRVCLLMRNMHLQVVLVKDGHCSFVDKAVGRAYVEFGEQISVTCQAFTQQHSNRACRAMMVFVAGGAPTSITAKAQEV